MANISHKKFLKDNMKNIPKDAIDKDIPCKLITESIVIHDAAECLKICFSPSIFICIRVNSLYLLHFNTSFLPIHLKC